MTPKGAVDVVWAADNKPVVEGNPPIEVLVRRT